MSQRMIVSGWVLPLCLASLLAGCGGGRLGGGRVFPFRGTSIFLSRGTSIFLSAGTNISPAGGASHFRA